VQLEVVADAERVGAAEERVLVDELVGRRRATDEQQRSDEREPTEQ
jgi:hypothetical protein